MLPNMVKQMRISLVIAACIVATAFLMPSAAATGQSCSVDQDHTSCDLACVKGDVLSVSASSTSSLWSAKISVSCGGATAECSAGAKSSCHRDSSTQATSADTGRCGLNASSGTGTCSASGGDRQNCIAQVGAVCVACPPEVCATPTPPNPNQVLDNIGAFINNYQPRLPICDPVSLSWAVQPISYDEPDTSLICDH